MLPNNPSTPRSTTSIYPPDIITTEPKKSLPSLSNSTSQVETQVISPEQKN